MTIKTQDGKVITKDGKVSCTCCAEPGCCTYTATPTTPTFPDTDLPDAVTINWPGYFEGSADRSGRAYSAGTVSLAINEAKTDWVLSDSATGQSRTVGECLLREAGGLVIDQFKAEYDFYAPFENSECKLTRIELCIWEYIDDQIVASGEGIFQYTEPYTPEREYALALVNLILLREGSNLPRRWYVEVYRLYNFFDEDDNEFLRVELEASSYKDGDNNKPDGTYPANSLAVTIS